MSESSLPDPSQRPAIQAEFMTEQEKFWAAENAIAKAESDRMAASAELGLAKKNMDRLKVILDKMPKATA